MLVPVIGEPGRVALECSFPSLYFCFLPPDPSISAATPPCLPFQISLLRRMPRIEYTFVLAGFLKILTIGSLAYSAPVDTLRTAAGTAKRQRQWRLHVCAMVLAVGYIKPHAATTVLSVYCELDAKDMS